MICFSRIRLLHLCFQSFMLGVLLVIGLSAKADDTDDVLHPFWASRSIRRETLLFVRESGEAHAKANLTFPIQNLFSVRQAAWSQGRQKTYVFGRDFIYSSGSRTLTLRQHSTISFRNRASFYSQTQGLPYKTKVSDPLNPYTPYGPSGKGPQLVYSDNEEPLQQVEVNYSYNTVWKGYVPKYQAVALRRTLQKLVSHQPMRLLVVGDSISYGYGSSLLGGHEVLGYYPRRPGYASLLVSALQRSYHTNAIRLENRAQPYIDSAQGAFDIGAQMTSSTDLVVVAYGMNDAANGVQGRRQDRIAAYKANIKNILNAIRAKNPAAEVILLAPMLGNPEWTRTLTPFFIKTSQFSAYSSIQQALRELAAQTSGVAIADMTQLWHDLLAAKGWQYQNLLDGKPLTGWYDLSANGVNHPNDYGHLLYAQVLAGLLIPAK